jgi:hypothetical protein
MMKRPSARPPEAGRDRRETRLSFAPSKSAQADLEPRHSVPLGDRPMYSSDEGFH